MAGYTAIANLETGLSVRGKLNTQFGELFGETAKSLVVAANAAAILAIPAEYLTDGKLVLQYDTATIYQWNGSAWIDCDLKLQSITQDWIDFVTDATVTMQEGRLTWNATDGTLELGMPGGKVNLQIGQELLIPRRVKNNTAGDMVNGQLVYISGGDGTNAYVTLAQADAEITSADTIAMLTEDVAAGAKGYATMVGIVRGEAAQPIDTSAYAVGDILYLSPDTAGAFTGTKPDAPDHAVVIGHVFRAHATEGQILVNVRNGWELTELHDVLMGDKTEGDLPYWDDTTGVWRNRGPKFGDVTGGNYSEFESDGTLKFNGDATVWNDIIIPGAGLRQGGSAPAFAVFIGGIFEYRFDAGQANEVHGSFEIQHDYKEGTALDFHVHWSPSTTNAGNIVWGVEYVVSNIGSAFAATAETVSMTPAAAPGVLRRHVLSDVAQVPGTGLKIGAIVAFRLFRQNGGTDTFTGNAFLHSVGVHYQSDTTGSRQELVK